MFTHQNISLRFENACTMLSNLVQAAPGRAQPRLRQLSEAEATWKDWREESACWLDFHWREIWTSVLPVKHAMPLWLDYFSRASLATSLMTMSLNLINSKFDLILFDHCFKHKHYIHSALDIQDHYREALSLHCQGFLSKILVCYSMCNSRNRNIYIILGNFPSIKMIDFSDLLLLISKMYSLSRKKLAILYRMWLRRTMFV